MKILQVITSLRIGGAENLIVGLAPILHDKGHQVDVLVFDGVESCFKQRLKDAGIQVYHLSIGKSVYNPINLLRLIPFLRRYDIVHTHNTAPQLFAAIGSVLCSVALVITEHNTSNRRRAWKWYRPIDRWMYSRYKVVISISHKATELLCKEVGVNQIYTIPNGVDLVSFKTAVSFEIKSKDEFIIMMVAGFREQKDQDTLIKAMTLLPACCKLWLVGDGERRKQCEILVHDCGVDDRVLFLGIRSDVPQLLKTADVTVMSSHFEGLSLSSIEGMTVGKPFVASDVNGLHEIVEGAGILFEHGNEREFADIIQHLMNDTEYYNRIAQQCMERAASYDISVTAERYNEVYSLICSKRLN